MRRGSGLSRMAPDDFRARYGIPGHPHLVVEGTYDETPHRRAQLNGWTVLDTRFTVFDRYHRNIVLWCGTLQEVHDWIRSGGPNRWDPERRKADKA